MKPRGLQSKLSSHPLRSAIAILWVASLGPGSSVALGQGAQEPAATTPTTTTTTAAAWKLPNDQLDSLVAPIALYPDPLLSQTLVASTYPLEIIQLQQWMDRNKTLKDKALADAVQKQNWDPSIQSMVAVPDVVQRMAGNIQWTTEMGNAFLAQPTDVMDAVQRMRAKAQGTNVLVSNDATESGNPGRRWRQRGDRDPASQTGGGLRAFLRSGGRLWRTRLSLSVLCLSGIRAGNGTGVWGRTHLGRRLGRRLGI